jgi:triacylglycerol lipase
MPGRRYSVNGRKEAEVSMWQELFVGFELVQLRLSSIFYGLGAPHGHGEAVILIPGFLGTDSYLVELFSWLRTVGYRSYFSGIGWNAECPNLLIRRRLNETIERAYNATGNRVHLIGHSLGGIIARSVAGQRPDQIASVTTLGSPFRGIGAHPNVLRVSDAIRNRILREHAGRVLPACYTEACTCDFVNSLRMDFPDEVAQTAVYTRNDGIVDWRFCITEDPEIDREVDGTHMGLVFNPAVYRLLAERLARHAAVPDAPRRSQLTPRHLRLQPDQQQQRANHHGSQ